MSTLEEDSQYYLNCTNLTYTQLNNMNLSRGVVAVFCVLLLVAMLTVLCAIKAYKSVVQRLFLYLIVITIVDEMCNVAVMEHRFHYPHQDVVCAAVGFATHWCSSVVVECAVGVIAYTVLLICVSFRRNGLPTTTLSRKARVFLEVLYLIVIILLPLTVIWIPFLNGNYGLAVAWCWIRTVHENCEKVAELEQLIMGYGGFEIVSIAGIVAFFGLSITYCRISTARFAQVRRLVLQSLTLTSFVLLYLVSANTGLAIRIYSVVTKWKQHYPMWIYHGVIIPICQLIIPFGFLGSFYFQHLRHHCCVKQMRRGYLRLEGANKTCPESTRVSMPSQTFFDVPYTDGFTSVTRTQVDSEEAHSQKPAAV